MRIGAIGGSYTVPSTAVADEETINWYQQTVESQGSIVPTSAYGGKNAGGLKSFFYTPGLSVFANLGGATVNGSIVAGDRLFAVSGNSFLEILPSSSQIVRGGVTGDTRPASLAYNGLQVLVVAGGNAYCYTLATNDFVNVSSFLGGVPVKVTSSDTYFEVTFQNSNKFQLSQVLDGTTWPGQLVNEVSVFPENIVSIETNHGELWVFGEHHTQVYQDTGSAEVFDIVPGALIETGCAATFSVARLDNSLFWVGEDERGARMAWRSNGYTPVRMSNFAVEADLISYPTIASMVSYSYQDRGHLFWVLYIPGAQWSWCYDVDESQWHKRATWNSTTSAWGPHLSWNHVWAFNRHLVGDWSTGTLYTLSANNFTDNGALIRRLRRTPIIIDEMQRVYHRDLTLDFDMGNLNAVIPSDLPDYAGFLYGPNQPNLAVNNSSPGGAAWNNPANATTGGYTSADLNGTSLTVTSVRAFSTNMGLPLRPLNYFVLVTFSSVPPAVGNTFDFSQVADYTTLNGLSLESQSGGGSFLPIPSADQALFGFGTTVIPLQADTADSGIAVVSTVLQYSQLLELTQYNLSLPSTATPRGIRIGILAYANTIGVTLFGQLMKGGSLVGNGFSFALGVAPFIQYVGDIESSLWGLSWLYNDIDASGFGVAIRASASSGIAATAFVGLVSAEVYAPPATQNFGYIGPNPVLVDGNGDPRPPQVMLRWSDDRGNTWSNEHILNVGNSGQYTARAIQRRLGQSRYRIYETGVTDPIPWVLVDEYLRLGDGGSQ
jgi:hypothetical protein